MIRCANILPLAACLSIAVCSVSARFSAPVQAQEPAKPAIYELRTYTTHPGKLDALHQRFRDHTLGLFAKHGMVNVIYWTPEDQPNTLIYLLQHASAEARDASFRAFRDDPVWQKVYAESRENGPLVAKVESMMLVPTDYSPGQTLAELLKDHAGALYELRIYTTHEGKLPNLNARFRDHTMKLFHKHGMLNVLYTTPLAGDEKENTLVYFIAHTSKAAADKSWQEFVNDPEWKKVAQESQRDGQILIPGGVKRVYLKPTDFSPIQ